MPWLDTRADSVRLAIRLTPRAGRNEILGIAGTADGGQVLKIEVTAAPENGEANRALIKLLAKKWRLAKSDITLVSGSTNRTKVVEIGGSPSVLDKTIRGSLPKSIRA